MIFVPVLHEDEPHEHQRYQELRMAAPRKAMPVNR